MAKAVKKTENDEERTRLKRLAITRNILSQTPSKPSSTFPPSSTVIKHDGKDIIKKSQRKNRFLFSFPGLLGPISGGKIGELKDLGTKNPIMYLDFPQGRMKLFGTIVHPKNRYLTLQFSKGGKNVMCEDHFDNMVVFSDAWWVGVKEENPEEFRLDFPKNLTEGKHTDSDFKGGAGATGEQKPGLKKPRKEYVEPESPSTEIEDISEDCSSPIPTHNDLMEVTPVRQSARTAGKTFKFAEGSSGESSAESDSDTSEAMREGDNEELDNMVLQTEHPIEDVIVVAKTVSVEKRKQSSVTVKSKEVSVSKRVPLMQPTISTLFEKAKGKVGGARNKAIPIRDSEEESQDGCAKNKVTPIRGRKPGGGSNKKQKKSQVEEDDIEELSSESEDIDEESDEEWAA